MLMITLVALLLAIPLSSSTISASLFTRITAISLLYGGAISYTSASVSSLDAGLGLYSGLLHATTVTQSMEVFLFVMAALILIPWASTFKDGKNSVGYSPATPSIPEYSMIIIFTTMGGTYLLASADLVSMYLAIELQSFGVYILAALYRYSESATAAGLKYFLLGALSSALILLGSALIYGYTGLTNLEHIYTLLSVPSMEGYTQGVVLGLVIISVGLLFKVAAAPFHYWAPDVYDGTPTIVTTWLTVMPKISLFIFMLELYMGAVRQTGGNADLMINTESIGTNLLLICAFLSLVIGTVVGLGQYRVKRLMAYSTISHVGFLLLALAITSEESTEAFLFYIVQYSLTNADAFFVILAFGYIINNALLRSGENPDVQFISEIKGQFRDNPILGLSLALCLFSIAGIPPLVGFFAKYTVLYTAIHNGYYFLAILAILTSVVSAVYYLRMVKTVHFDAPATTTYLEPGEVVVITSVHSYTIAVLTLFLVLFAYNPNLLLNSTWIMALSLYTT